MANAVVGIVKNVSEVEAVIDRLQSRANIPLNDVSVLVPDTGDTKDLAHVKATKAPEGATTGVVTGGLAGGVLGALVGIGTLAIPGLGAFIAAGPIMAALGGAAAGAAAGGVVGALVGMGIPEYEAKVYEEKLREGHYLIAIHNVGGDRAKQVQEVLKEGGAESVSSVSEASR